MLKMNETEDTVTENNYPVAEAYLPPIPAFVDRLIDDEFDEEEEEEEDIFNLRYELYQFKCFYNEKINKLFKYLDDVIPFILICLLVICILMFFDNGSSQSGVSINIRV